MNKTEFAIELAKRSGMTQEQAKKVTAFMSDILYEQIAARNRIELRGLGIFLCRFTAEHQGRNPRSGESITIPASYRVIFQPCARLKKDLNRDER